MGEVLEYLESASNYRDWIFGAGASNLGRRVLEVGAGTGTMTACLSERDFVLALEIEAGFADALRRRLGHWTNLEVAEGSATDGELLQRVAGGRIDSAMSFNVLEHIEDDVGVLRNVFNCLPSGGRFVCFVPAMPILFGAMDEALGHFRRYTRRELTRKAGEAGFRVVSIHYLNAVGCFLWFINGRILRSTGEGRDLALVTFDRFVVPLIRTLEARVKPPFGQSLLLVAEKP
jgi:SAM-dependent methyltransferase